MSIANEPVQRERTCIKMQGSESIRVEWSILDEDEEVRLAELREVGGIGGTSAASAAASDGCAL